MREVARHAFETGAALASVATVATRNLDDAVLASGKTAEDLDGLAKRAESIRALVQTEFNRAREDIRAFRQRVDDIDRRVANYQALARGVRVSVDSQARSFGEHVRTLLVILIILVTASIAAQLFLR